MRLYSIITELNVLRTLHLRRAIALGPRSGDRHQFAGGGAARATRYRGKTFRGRETIEHRHTHLVMGLFDGLDGATAGGRNVARNDRREPRRWSCTTYVNFHARPRAGYRISGAIRIFDRSEPPAPLGSSHRRSRG